MTWSELAAYLASVRAKHEQSIFIPRRMTGRAEWDRASGED